MFKVFGLLKLIWQKFDGKKVTIGASSFLFWVVFYAMPAFSPQYNWITAYATEVRDFLIANGIQLDNASFNVGVFATVIGLLDKFRKAKEAKKNE